MLLLRSNGIKFEEQKNLPNEPPYKTVRNAIKKFHKIGLLDKESNDLTELGENTSKYPVPLPFAIAITKYDENETFPFLISLIIERSFNLIANSQSQLLCDNFCRDSDVVTILDSLLALNTKDDDKIIKEKEIKYENSGFSICSLESIYLTIANTFDEMKIEDGRNMAIKSIIWAKNQPGGIISMVDNFVALLDFNGFLDCRKASFLYIAGAGNKSEPIIVYEANEKFSFEGESESTIKFSQRPGWNGLQSPGNIIVLSLQVEEAANLNRGFILHRDPTTTADENLGAVSQEVDEYLNSCFFIALFESYFNHKIIKKLIPIYHSFKAKEETAFLIHIIENNKKTYINYCPKSKKIKKKMKKMIPTLSSLMPFVPRSIIAKIDVPKCVVEVVSYGTSENYETYVYLNDDESIPIAYPLNDEVLDYAKDHIKELKKKKPKIRFAITGESILYKFKKGIQVETDFKYPTSNKNIKSVFNPIHSSHLVLLVDKKYDDLPSEYTIPWTIKKSKKRNSKASNEKDEIKLLIDVSTKILNGFGYVQKISDIFFITLNKGYPCVNEGQIPETI